MAAILEHVEGELVCGSPDRRVNFAFASDLLSDVLTVTVDELLFITGLATAQAIRTSIVSDISSVLLVRGKRATPDMIQLATENDITVIRSPYTMYRASGVLFSRGLKPVY
jgi:serine kinase of HPr protein (carbohydrate metabolism regulator)